MNISQQLRRIARSISVIQDSDDDSILILCQKITNCPRYITIKLQNGKWKLIKIIDLPNKYNYQQLDFQLIKFQKNFPQAIKDKLFEYEKTVDIEELKQQLIYGKFNLDVSMFKQLYGSDIEHFEYRNYTIYLLNDNFQQNEVKHFIDQIYHIVPNSLLNKYKMTLQFKNNLQSNHVAQYDSGVIQIREYNIHAFIHQLGHAILENIRFNADKAIKIRESYNHSNYPSSLSRQNVGEYFAQLFAYYHLDKSKLTSQQIDLIDYMAFDKRIYRAKIKLYRIMSGDPCRVEYDNYIESLSQHSNRKLVANKIYDYF